MGEDVKLKTEEKKRKRWKWRTFFLGGGACLSLVVPGDLARCQTQGIAARKLPIRVQKKRVKRCAMVRVVVSDLAFTFLQFTKESVVI